MSEEQDKSQKSHQPTEQKLQELRKKGEIPRSSELNAAVALTSLTLLSLFFGSAAIALVGENLRGFFWLWEGFESIDHLFERARDLRALTFDTTLPVAGIVFFAGGMVLIGLIAQRAVVFAPEKVKPKLSRISILKTAKSKFGAPGMFEFAKSFAKLVVYSGTLSLLMYGHRDEILGSLWGSAGQISGLMMRLTLEMLAISSGIALTLGALDFLWQRQHFLNSHMMSRQDIKDEVKRSEGDPEQKAERQRRAKEVAQNRMMRDVPLADVVVVNPTHYSVALKWDRESKGAAPVCVAKGVDHLASRIREIALENGIPIFSDPPSARAMHASVEVGDEIEFEHYEAVAAAIRYADVLRRKTKARI